MRKLLFIAMMFFIPIFGYAQFTVTDPGNLAAMVKQMDEMVKQTGELGKQSKSLLENRNLLQTSVNFVQKVNDKLRSAKYARQVLSDQVSLVTNCSRTINNLNKNPLYNIQSTCSTVETILLKNQYLTELLAKVLSPEMKMNDAERLDALMKIEEKTAALNKELQSIETAARVGNEMMNLLK